MQGMFETRRKGRMKTRLISILAALALAVISVPLGAQNTFSSGSTGADGAFAPAGNQTIIVPPSGVFNYTTITIPNTVIITYLANAANTPLTILASGDVQISGTIHLDGQNGNTSGFGGIGGPGGGRGGNAGVNFTPGTSGDGPGGGKGGLVTAGPPQSCSNGGGGGGGFQVPGAGALGGVAYGTRNLIPLIGGSGGGGGCGANLTVGTGAGGGGGALLLASSTSITFGSGAHFTANGGIGGGKTTQDGGGGGGSGGAIRFVSNAISGSVSLEVNGGNGGGVTTAAQSGTNGGFGFLRAEAFNLTGFSPSTIAPMFSGLPSSAVPTNLPTLQIVSVAGVAAPATPLGSFQGSPDIILPAAQANPVSVVVNATNVPSGTTVNVTATSATGSATTAAATLAGTTGASSGTANVSLPTGLSVLTATTLIDLAQIGDLKPLFINGEKVEKIEVAATYGGAPEWTYITQSGRRIRTLQ
jgi:hypothetical protein